MGTGGREFGHRSKPRVRGDRQRSYVWRCQRRLNPFLREDLAKLTQVRVVVVAAVLFRSCRGGKHDRGVKRQCQRLRRKAHAHEEN